MARIQGVQRDQAGPMVRLVYWFMRKGMTKMTGRQPAYGSGIEPVEIWAYQPKMMSGMGKFQQAVWKGHTVDERLKNLVERPPAPGARYRARGGRRVRRIAAMRPVAGSSSYGLARRRASSVPIRGR